MQNPAKIGGLGYFFQILKNFLENLQENQCDLLQLHPKKDHSTAQKHPIAWGGGDHRIYI